MCVHAVIADNTRKIQERINIRNIVNKYKSFCSLDIVYLFEKEFKYLKQVPNVRFVLSKLLR